MKRLLLALLFIVFVAQPCLGAVNVFTTSVDNKQTYKNSYRWTGKHKDLLLLWAKEVEDRLDGTTYNQSLFLQPTTAPTATEGRFYYDATANKIKFHNGTGWITIEAASGNALDDAYDAGEGITVDSGTAVTLTTSAASDSAALAIVHGETGNFAGMTLTNASAYPGIQITTSGGGADITGTSATWSIAKTGAATLVGITNTSTVNHDSANVFFDATDAGKDLEWDDSQECLHFLDNCILGIGGATTVAPDFAIMHNGTDANVIPAADAAVWKWGDGTSDIDMWWYGSASGDYFWWDESGAELLFVDAHIGLADDGTLTFGTNDDFVVSSAADGVLVIAPDAQGNEIRFGTTNADAVVLTWYSDSSGDTVVFDEDNIMVEFEDVKLALGDATPILFGDTIGAGTISMQASTNDLVIDGVVANTGSVQIGNDANGIDFHLYARTASDDLLWDASDERLEGVGCNISWDDGYISLGDGDAILLGDALGTGDLTISSTSAVLSIDGTTPGTGSVYIGQDNLDILFKWFGETASSFFQFTGDQLQCDGVQIALDDGDAILFGTTLGTGDFSIADTSDVLVIKQVAAGTGTVEFGVDDANDFDVKFFGDTASSFMEWDADGQTNGALVFDAADIHMGDTDFVVFGDGADFTMTSATAANFSVNGAASDETDTFNFGADGDGLLVLFHSATGSDLITWDAANEALEFVGVDLVMDTDSITTLDAVNQGVVLVTDAAAYTCLVNNSGQVHVITDLAQNTTIKLPVEAAGLNYKFIYCAIADEAHDHIIDSENNTNFFIGGVSFWDTDAGNGADETNAGIYSDGNSNSKLTINNISAGTEVEMWCDGTNWYLSGQVLSDTAPTLGDQ